MKRIVVALALLLASSVAADTQKFRPLAQGANGVARYRVAVVAPDDGTVEALARQLAATYRARLEPYAQEGFAGFLVSASEAAARLMSTDPRVLLVEQVEDLATTPDVSAPAPPSVVAVESAPLEPEPSVGRTASISAGPSEVVAHANDSWETTGASGTYSYDGAGNITAIGNDTFVYDAFGRLTSGSAGAGRREDYTYDRYGNLLTITTDGNSAAQKTLGVNATTNRLTDTSKSVFGTYDGEGNMRSYLGTDTYAYDRLGSMTRSRVDGVEKIYLYSASDERIAAITVTGGVATKSEVSLRDPQARILRRYTTNGGLTATWGWEEDYIYRDSALLAAELPTGRRHFHLDHLGTPRLITDGGGNLVARHTYYPFGHEATNPAQDTERAKFTGHERDAATLDYMHARYYNGRMGRFLSVDPYLDLQKATRYPQNWNRYSYVRNNPINLVDPDGRDDVNTGGDWDEPGAPNPEKDKAFRDDVALRVLGGVSWAIATFVLDGGPEYGDGERPKDARSSVQANKKAGDAFRDQVADGLKTEGREVKTEVVKKTPFGPRRVDIEVSQGGKVVGGVETKVGNSRYTPSQRAKDAWLRKVKDYVVVVVRKVL